MIVSCEQCNASFNLNESLLKPSGSKVRCSKCNSVFMAYPPAAQDEPVTPTEVVPDPGVEEEKTPETEEGAEEVVEELDLDLDLGAEEEKTPEPEEAAEEAVEELDLDLDLETEEIADDTIEDLDLELDLEADEVTEVTEDVFEKLDLDLEADEVTEAAEDAIEDLGMELDLETEEIADDAIEDLDLELDLEADEVTEDAIEDLDLDFEADEEKTPETAEDAEDAIEDLELELEMDMEPESEPVSDDAAAVKAEEPDELDLSDLEEMLDVKEGTEAEEEVELEEVDLELDMDMGLELDAADDDVAATEPDVADLEELSELEEMLDLDEETAADDTVEDEIDAVDKSFELEFEDALTAESEEADQAQATDDSFYEETHVVEPGALLAAAAVGEEKEEEERPIPAKKKRISMPLLIGLVAVLLAGAAYGTLIFLNSKNIRVPFVSDLLFEPQVEDAGNLMITPLGVNGKFVENAKTGQLFVITGRVKNDYSHNRRFIKVAGQLFTKGKGAAKTATVFCGNFLTDIELSNFDLAAITKRLMNRYGDKKSNLTIKPGQMIPFMIVFSNLPNDLDEFSVEVTESIQG